MFFQLLAVFPRTASAGCSYYLLCWMLLSVLKKVGWVASSRNNYVTELGIFLWVNRMISYWHVPVCNLLSSMFLSGFKTSATGNSLGLIFPPCNGKSFLLEDMIRLLFEYGILKSEDGGTLIVSCIFE